MVIVDSHCHLDLISHGDQGLSGTIAEARAAGVHHILTVSTDLEHFHERLAIAESFEGVSVSIGLHPAEEEKREVTEAELIELGGHSKVIAVGETGLDYYHCKGDVTWQHARFIRHIEAALALNKPLIIHSREAWDDTLRLLRTHQAIGVGGVLHCFSGSLEIAMQGIEMGFLISLSGALTFKNSSEVQGVVRELPLEHLLVETDAPYLAPVPHRGKSNTPAYVRHVVEKIAELKGLSAEYVAEQTTRNFEKKFRVKVC